MFHKKMIAYMLTIIYNAVHIQHILGCLGIVLEG
jgi:hypothetical protein